VFPSGDVVVLAASGRRASVGHLLGEGSQGAVYLADVEHGGAHALKWYFPHAATPAQRDAIETLLLRGAPAAQFLWPLELARSGTRPEFGYVMALRPPQHVGLGGLLTGAVDVGIATVLTVCLELSHAFLSLHAQGLCYRDISFGNVFFDPATGGVLVLDNDNVAVDGGSSSPVLGTRRFMAPEIVRRAARPSANTDRWSLAVLLFYVLMVGHPLLGQRELGYPLWDEGAEYELFGRAPLFVFDPDDVANAPVPGLHDSVLANWAVYPGSLRALFVASFCEGRTNPDGRVRESVWRRELSLARDRLLRCPRCRAENFAGPDGAVRCWACGALLPEAVRLVTRWTDLVLDGGTAVRAHHLKGTYDFGTVLGRVVTHPERPGVWGLRNESDQPWRARLPDGRDRVVEPGRTLALVPGARLVVEGQPARLVFGRDERPPGA
jgi:DNA-binding helix-hairpin-helix protein with protein kinase domain